MNRIERYFLQFLDNPVNVIAADVALVAIFLAILFRHQVRFMLKSLTRNWLRTVLTSLATMMLVFVVTLVWSILWLLDRITSDKVKDLKAIVTERWQIPSQMPMSYADVLIDGAARTAEDVKPVDSMTWQFYGGTVDDKTKMTRENMLFFFCMEPKKLLTMMDDLDQLSDTDRTELERVVRVMTEDPTKVVIGKDRLKALNKKQGERIKVFSMNYKDIDIDGLEIIGTFPDGRYNQSAVMNRDLLNRALDAYKTKNGNPHPLDQKRLNLVWLKIPDMKTYQRMAEQIETTPKLSSPAVKSETASSGVAAFLDAYRDMLWGMRWLLVPAILVTMALVIANAISISVRERRIEMAVLKVLGYGPTHIMMLVLGEALLIGILSGLFSAALSYVWINHVVGGIKFPIGFFPAFLIPGEAFWWGPTIGALTAFFGSIVPSWSARSVKVSEVFSKIS